MSPIPELGENDDNSLLEGGEVDMRAKMQLVGSVMEFELLRLPPQSKTVGPWTFQQSGRGRRKGQGKVVCFLPSHLLRMYLHMCVRLCMRTMCGSCMQDVMC